MKIEKIGVICQRSHKTSDERTGPGPGSLTPKPLLPHCRHSRFSYCEPGKTNLERRSGETQRNHGKPREAEKRTEKGVRSMVKQRLGGWADVHTLAESVCWVCKKRALGTVKVFISLSHFLQVHGD